jgi:hypothetical protein
MDLCPCFLYAEKVVLTSGEDSSADVLDEQYSEEIDIVFKETETKQKILSSREKFNEIKPLLDRIAAHCTSFGSSLFRKKKQQLNDFVNAWLCEDDESDEKLANEEKHLNFDTTEDKDTAKSVQERIPADNAAKELKNSQSSSTSSRTDGITLEQLKVATTRKNKGRARKTEKQVKAMKKRKIVDMKNEVFGIAVISAFNSRETAAEISSLLENYALGSEKLPAGIEAKEIIANLPEMQVVRSYRKLKIRDVEEMGMLHSSSVLIEKVSLQRMITSLANSRDTHFLSISYENGSAWTPQSLPFMRARMLQILTSFS